MSDLPLFVVVGKIATDDEDVSRKKFIGLLGGAMIEFPKQPFGKTSWADKCKIVEARGIQGLMFSPEVMDVSMGYILSTPEQITSLADPVVQHALITSNLEVLYFLSAARGVGFKEKAEHILYTGVINTEMKGNSVVFLPPATLDILAHPSFGLRIDYPLLMHNSIYEGNVVLVKHLREKYPQINIQTHGQEYLLIGIEADDPLALSSLVTSYLEPRTLG